MSNDFLEDKLRDLHGIIQNTLLTAYPNPERRGCPGTQVLREIAALRTPEQHPQAAHLMRCSPCLREMLELRVPTRKRGPIFALYALAALLIAGVGALLYQQLMYKGDLVTHSQVPAQGALNASLSYDASLSSEARDAEAPRVLKPMQLLRAHDLHLAITLPLGLDPGDYDTRLCHTDDPNPVCFSTGHATMNKTSQRSLLTTTLRTDRLPPGEYIFFFRRLGNKGWHPLPAQLPALR